MRILLMVFAVLSTLTTQLHAQTAVPAILVADHVTIESNTRLVAQGNVEAIHGDVHLYASRIVYDQSTDSLTLEGPVRIADGSGNLMIADSATLDSTLENGILMGARLVMDEQLQLASVQARRVDGRYTQMSKVAITSCQVCGQNQTPLWQIRASSVVHDQKSKQIYIDDAKLLFLDLPVFYFPHLRLPDPTLKRSRGFLTPNLSSSTLLGFGVKIPYFVPVGDHSDLTFTPYLSPITRTLETRYRRAFRYGDIEINTAISQDSVTTSDNRAYVFAEGSFDLKRDFKLTFDIEAVTDDSYLSNYDYSDKDRLDSELTISRVRKDEFISGSLIHYESLRAGESNATLPTIVGDARYEARYFPTSVGGELRLSTEAHSHYRYSDADTDGLDVGRLNAEVNYLNRWTLAGGIRAGVDASLWADHFRIYQDSTSDSVVTQLTPAISTEFRWPWTRSGANGSKTLLEPMVQVGWVGGSRPNIPNDESTRVEFDEGNLLSLSRYPAADRRERGLVGAAGFRWVQKAATGWSANLTVGRVWREHADSSLTVSSGQTGRASDWLIATQFTSNNGLSLMARGLLGEDFDFDKVEVIADWAWRRLDLEASYVLVSSDAALSTDALSEWTLDSSYRFSDDWAGSSYWRYDLVDNRLDEAGLGLDYSNECVDVGFSVSRSFASSTSVEPSTTFGLTVALKGFSTGGSAKEYNRTCS